MTLRKLIFERVIVGIEKSWIGIKDPEEHNLIHKRYNETHKKLSERLKNIEAAAKVSKDEALKKLILG